MLKLLLPLFIILQLSGCAAVVVGGAATGAAIVHDRRSPGTVLDDQGIELHAKKMILEVRRGDKKVRVTPVAYNGQLLLLGQVPSWDMQEQIIDRLRRIDKVRQIHNETTISDPIPMKVRSHDAWITTRIKSDMLLSKVVDPTRIKVVTEDSVVYLMGVVWPNEEEEADALARKIEGVERVVKIFDYL